MKVKHLQTVRRLDRNRSVESCFLQKQNTQETFILNVCPMYSVPVLKAFKDTTFEDIYVSLYV